MSRERSLRSQYIQRTKRFALTSAFAERVINLTAYLSCFTVHPEVVRAINLTPILWTIVLAELHDIFFVVGLTP